MIEIPDVPPNITSITFQVFRGSDESSKRFMYDPDEHILGDSLNDAGLDANTYFVTLVNDVALTKAVVSIAFDHGARFVLPVPVQGKAPELGSLGQLVVLMVETMRESGQFADRTPDNDLVMHLCALIGRYEEPEARSAPRP